MIEIQNLQGLSEEQIVDLLLEQKSQPFEIYIPKETQRFSSDNESIADDYLNAAYAGQMLSDVAEKFDYEFVSPDKHESILFTVKCADIEALAEALLEISYLYVNDHPDPIELWDGRLNFIDEVEKKKIVPACQDFIEVYNEFIDA